MLAGLIVYDTDLQGREAAPAVLKSMRHACPWLRHLVADGGYVGPKSCTVPLTGSASGHSRSSSAPVPPAASKSSPDDGSAEAPSHGSATAVGRRKTGKNPLPQVKHGLTSPTHRRHVPINERCRASSRSRCPSVNGCVGRQSLLRLLARPSRLPSRPPRRRHGCSAGSCAHCCDRARAQRRAKEGRSPLTDWLRYDGGHAGGRPRCLPRAARRTKAGGHSIEAGTGL